MRFYKAVRILSLLGVLSGLYTDINGMEEPKESYRKTPFSDFAISINDETSYRMFGQNFENYEEANKLKESVLSSIEQLSKNRYSLEDCEDIALLDDISCVIRLVLGQVMEITGEECLSILQYLSNSGSTRGISLLWNLSGEGVYALQQSCGTNLDRIEAVRKICENVKDLRLEKGKTIFYMAVLYGIAYPKDEIGDGEEIMKQARQALAVFK